ncbi:MAG TPA: hypothetical protein VK782_03945 [Candidatus Sulfotelmatobacter sp.]|nr:hypothetical protein [Candidatus Sulfotelmatobacter sp.]
MRAVRLRLAITVLIVSPFLILALSDSKLARQPFAQVTAAPGPVVVPAPFAPGAPQAFSTIGALPSLAAAPGFTPFAAASVAPTPRAFRCTCGAPGTWTEWAGVVSSSSFVLASQSARGQCANFLLNANAPSPFIQQNGGAALNQQRPTIFNGTAFTQRSQVSTSVGQSERERSAVTALTTECTRCACN